MRLRVVSYNVRYFGHPTKGVASTQTGLDGIAAALAALDPAPHVVCLQEVEATSWRSRLTLDGRSPWSLQLDAFMAALRRQFRLCGRSSPYEPLYFFAHAHRLRSLKIASMGLAVLVDAEQLRVESHNCAAPHRVTHHSFHALKERKQNRICAHVRLAAGNGHPLHVFNTHLSLPSPFARRFWQGERMGFGHNQVEEAKKLAAYVHRLAGGEPFVLAGDFNSPPGSPVYRFLTEEAGLVSAQAAVGQIDGRSPKEFPTAGFMALRMHLDHLFTSGLKVLDLDGTVPFGDRRSPFWGRSDHMPLIARLELP